MVNKEFKQYIRMSMGRSKRYPVYILPYKFQGWRIDLDQTNFRKPTLRIEQLDVETDQDEQVFNPDLIR